MGAGTHRHPRCPPASPAPAPPTPSLWEKRGERGGMYPPGVPRCPPTTSPGASSCSQVSSSIPQGYILNCVPRCPPVSPGGFNYSQVFPSIPRACVPAMSPGVSLCPQVSLCVPSRSPRVSRCPQVYPPMSPSVFQVSLSDLLPCSRVSPHVPTCPKLSQNVPRYFQVSPSVRVPRVPGCPRAFPLSPPFPSDPRCPSVSSSFPTCPPLPLHVLPPHCAGSVPACSLCPQGVPPRPRVVPSRCWQRAPLYPGGQRQEPWTQEPPCRQGREG